MTCEEWKQNFPTSRTVYTLRNLTARSWKCGNVQWEMSFPNWRDISQFVLPGKRIEGLWFWNCGSQPEDNKSQVILKSEIWKTLKHQFCRLNSHATKKRRGGLILNTHQYPRFPQTLPSSTFYKHKGPFPSHFQSKSRKKTTEPISPLSQVE